MDIESLTPLELKNLLEKQSDTILLDVRESWERALCRLENDVWIPMNEIAVRHNELPDGVPIVVYCHHGVRSLNVARYLAHLGFEDVRNLRGGIDLWALEMDSELARY